MKSIIQNEKECFICHTTLNLHCHHIYFGPNRKISEKNGFKVWLCYQHHEGTSGVHGKNGKKINIYLKQLCQKEFEKTHTREEFRGLIGESYL